MPIWPNALPIVGNEMNLSTASLASLGLSSLVFTSATWPTSNKALYVPFRCPDIVVAKLWWFNGATVSGSADMGIFGPDGTKLASTGSTTQASGNTIQSVDITDFMLEDGLYYFGLVLNNTTGTMFRYAAPSAMFCQMLGLAEQVSANVPLPAAATFASCTGTAIPLCGLTLGTVL